MQQLFKLALLACILLASVFGKCAGKPSKPDLQSWCQAAFRADSGFVDSRQANLLLQLLCQEDTSLFTPDFCDVLAETNQFPPAPVTADSMGKYFAFPEQNGARHWMLCIQVNLNETHPYVFEFQEKAGKFSWTGYGIYPHGNWACCWEGKWEEFYRLGPYFGLNTCNTGSGFCSTDLNVLSFPLGPAFEPAIPVYLSQNISHETLLSEISFLNDTIRINYRFQTDTLVENATGEQARRLLTERHFTGYFKINTVLRKIECLNRDALINDEASGWIFEDF